MNVKYLRKMARISTLLSIYFFCKVSDLNLKIKLTKQEFFKNPALKTQVGRKDKSNFR